ncbi:MAG: hypothetical protein AAGA25_06865 [Planctomycetota bacterium]
MTHEQITSVLVEENLLTQDQRTAVLTAPGVTSDNQCFLEHAAKHLNLDEVELLGGLIEHTRRNATEVKLTQTAHDPAALEYICARDAWDYLILPLAIEPTGHLLCCTTSETLGTALAYLTRTLAIPFSIVITDIRPLELYIAEQYHYEGVDLDTEAA